MPYGYGESSQQKLSGGYYWHGTIEVPAWGQLVSIGIRNDGNKDQFYASQFFIIDAQHFYLEVVNNQILGGSINWWPRWCVYIPTERELDWSQVKVNGRTEKIEQRQKAPAT